MNKKQFEARVREVKKNLGEDPIKFSVTEETFDITCYVFNFYGYIDILEHYHDHALGKDEYSETTLVTGWLREILEKCPETRTGGKIGKKTSRRS